MQINNLARDNLQDKLEIMSDLVTDEFWPWFANYMVVKRAAQVTHCTALSSHAGCPACTSMGMLWYPVPCPCNAQMCVQ